MRLLATGRHLALRPWRVEGLVKVLEAIPTHWCVRARPEISTRINAAALGITTAAVGAVLGPETSCAVVETLHIHRVAVPTDRVLRCEVVLGFTSCFSLGRIKRANRTTSSASKSKNKPFHNALTPSGNFPAATG